jgi:peptide/nickel transport system substrate-binding protein
MDLSTKIQSATLVLMTLVVGSSTLNMCAVDRLEKQVIENRQILDDLNEKGISGGGGRMVTNVSSTGAPGTSTGITASGWDGAVAEVTFVEGAVNNAPLTLGDKPLPQNDHYVNRRTSPPGSLNYYTTNEGDTATITKYVLGRLLILDPDSPPDVLPGLATSWEVSDDKLTYTYHLRKGVQHGDGRQFTSADVKFSFDVMRDPEVQADHLRSSFDDVVELTTPDPYTVVVRYAKPYWKGIYTVGYQLRILNKGWYEEQIPNYADKLDIAEYATEPGKPGFGEVFNKIRVPSPSTGPYYYASDEYDPTKVELRQNPFSWQTQTDPTFYNFKVLRWVFISDKIAAFEAFRKGEFDITVVDFNHWDDELSNDPTINDLANYVEYSHTGSGFSFISFNVREAPFDDPKVRLAMSHLVNREWVNTEIERGRGWVGVCPLKPEYASYHPDLKPHPYDPEKARELLAEAGWTDSDGDGVLDKDGQRFEFVLTLGSQRRFYTQISNQFEDALKQVGIRMTTRTLEWSTFIEDYYERRWQAVSLYNSFADPWIDPYEEWHSSQDVPRGGNSPGWHSPELDKLLEDMRGNFDDDSRNKQMHEMCEMFHAEPPVMVLNHGEVGVLVHSRIREAKVRPTGMQIHEMWVPVEETLHD